MRTFGLSHQIKGPTTVKLAFLQLIQLEPVLATFTVVGPLIWCDNPKVRMSKILYINNNNFHHLGRPQMCAAAWYVFGTWKPHSETLWHLLISSKSSLPIGLSEFWESEPIGTCKNINPIHDQGCGYHYLDDRPSKWGFPLTLTKTTWIFNFYCTAVFLKAIQLPWTRWFQKCITLGCQIPRSSF